MTGNSSSNLPAWLDYFTLRFWRRLPALLRKLLLRRMLLKRAVWVRALLGGLLIAQLRLGSAGASEPVFIASNPLVGVNAEDHSSPALVDIDNDGDLDAFSGDENGNILYFANTGNASDMDFAPAQTNPFGLGDVGSFSSPALVDIDGDGDLDAFSGEANGNIIYFTNTGNPANPAFAAPQTNPFGLADVGLNSSPALVDIDDDGDLDLFSGEKSGPIIYFTNTGNATSPAFAAPQTNPFGLTGIPVGYNHLTLVDIDGDGDLDVFSGETFGSILYFANTGSANSPAFAPIQVNPFGLSDVGSYSTPTLADIDGDSDLDAFSGEQYGTLFYFANTGSANSPAFALIPANPFDLIPIGFNSSPALADIDGDGDLDAFAGEFYGRIVYFENTSSANSPAFGPFQINPFGLEKVEYFNSPVLVDIDGDGDLDLFSGEAEGNLIYFANTGNASSPAFAAPQTNPFGLADAGDYCQPALVDIDQDGDLDAFSGEIDGSILYFANTGNANSPAFAAPQTNPFGLTDVGFNSSPALVDIDEDGDLDVFSGERFGNILYFANTGTASSPAFAPAQTNPFSLADVGNVSTPTLVDIDDDGDLDAFSGETNGTIVYFRNDPLKTLTLTTNASTTLVAPGHVLTYTLALFNDTPTDVLNAVISDPLPAGLTFKGPVNLDPPGIGTTGAPPTLVSGLTISAGQRITVTFPVTVNPGLTNGTRITNTITLTGTGLTTPVTAINVVTIAIPELLLVKSANLSEVEPGQVLTYSLAVLNNGATPALDTVISDTLPAGLTFKGPVSLDPPGIGTTGAPPTLVSSLTISAGQRITVTFPVTVNASLANGALITNTAAVTSSNVLTSATGSHVITVTVTINGTAVRLPIILKSQ